MIRKSALYALAVVVLMGSMAVSALAEVGVEQQGVEQPGAGEIREPMATGAVPERSASSSGINSYSSGDLPDLPTVEYGGQQFREGVDTP